MSSIPSSKMKHAHVHEGEHPEQSEPTGGSGGQPAVGDVGSGGGDTKAAPKADKKDGKGTGTKLSAQAKKLAERAEDLAEEAVDAVKARPKTAAAIGAALVAGAAAIVGGPAAARALKGDDEKKPATKSKTKKTDKA